MLKLCDDTCVSKQAKNVKKKVWNTPSQGSQGSSSGACSALTALKCADSDRAGAGEACREFIGRTGAFKAWRRFCDKNRLQAINTPNKNITWNDNILQNNAR